MSTKVFTEDHDWVSSDGKVKRQSQPIPSLCGVLLWRRKIALPILVLQPLFVLISPPPLAIHTPFSNQVATVGITK
jgi:hypothetical protein